LPYFEVQRAKIVLLAAEGLTNEEIAARLDTRREVVWLWRKRFFSERLAGLDERQRPGRPRTFSIANAPSNEEMMKVAIPLHPHLAEFLSA
jgi:transposase